MTRLTNPLPIFLDATGSLLDAGHIYVGIANGDPQSQPVAVYWDKDRKISAAQPLRTLGGVIVNGATPSQVYMAATDYSLRILDADFQLVRYDPSSAGQDDAYQPVDADLTAIAEQGTTDYGRALLNLPNTAALRTATGIPDPLPASGGAVSGPVTRSGAGRYLHHADSSIIGDNFHNGNSDPVGGTAGDFYFQWTA